MSAITASGPESGLSAFIPTRIFVLTARQGTDDKWRDQNAARKRERLQAVRDVMQKLCEFCIA